MVFQEKLGILLNDKGFREAFLEPMLYSGITDEHLEKIINYILDDEEVKTLVEGMAASEVKADLKILLKKLIERFTKFKSETSDDYIG